MLANDRVALGDGHVHRHGGAALGPHPADERHVLSNFNNKVANNEDLMELFEQTSYSLTDVLTIASLVERATALLCWARVSLNTCLPSAPRT